MEIKKVDMGLQAEIKLSSEEVSNIMHEVKNINNIAPNISQFFSELVGGANQVLIEPIKGKRSTIEEPTHKNTKCSWSRKVKLKERQNEILALLQQKDNLTPSEMAKIKRWGVAITAKFLKQLKQKGLIEDFLRRRKGVRVAFAYRLAENGQQIHKESTRAIATSTRFWDENQLKPNIINYLKERGPSTRSSIMYFVAKAEKYGKGVKALEELVTEGKVFERVGSNNRTFLYDTKPIVDSISKTPEIWERQPDKDYSKQYVNSQLKTPLKSPFTTVPREPIETVSIRYTWNNPRIRAYITNATNKIMERLRDRTLMAKESVSYFTSMLEDLREKFKLSFPYSNNAELFYNSEFDKELMSDFIPMFLERYPALQKNGRTLKDMDYKLILQNAFRIPMEIINDIVDKNSRIRREYFESIKFK